MKKLHSLNTQMVGLKAVVLGSALEKEVLEKYKSVLVKYLGRHSQLFDRKEVEDMAETARYLGANSDDDYVAAIAVDFLIAAGMFVEGRGQEYLVGEISNTIKGHDVKRAYQRARIWGRVLGEASRCIPLAVGRKVSKKVLEEANMAGVSIVSVGEEEEDLEFEVD
jgi:hypothetical protein